MSKVSIPYLLFAMTFVMISSLDMYLPIAPLLAEYFAVDDTVIKLTVLVGPLASCVAGTPFGYLSDRRGRRPLLFFGIGLYLLGSFICGVSTDITSFFVGRSLQSLGVGGLSVLANAILADLYHGVELARYLGIYAAVFPLAFGTAPIAGAQIDALLGWRWIFFALTAAMAIVAYLLWRVLPETHSEESRTRGQGGWSVLRQFLSSPLLLGLTLAHSLPICVGAIFTVNAAFLYEQVFAFDPIAFSYIQALPVAVQFLGANAYRLSVHRLGVRNGLHVGAMGALLFLCIVGLGFRGPYGVVLTVCCFTFFSVFAVSSSWAILMDQSTCGKGMTVSLAILLRNLVLAVIVAASGFCPHDAVAPMLLGMSGVAVVVFFLLGGVSMRLGRENAQREG